MKVDNFSVVRLRNGVGIRYEAPFSKEMTDPEVCISVENGRMSISVYYDDKDYKVIEGKHVPCTEMMFTLERRK